MSKMYRELCEIVEFFLQSSTISFIDEKQKQELLLKGKVCVPYNKDFNLMISIEKNKVNFYYEPIHETDTDD